MRKSEDDTQTMLIVKNEAENYTDKQLDKLQRNIERMLDGLRDHVDIHCASKLDLITGLAETSEKIRTITQAETNEKIKVAMYNHERVSHRPGSLAPKAKWQTKHKVIGASTITAVLTIITLIIEHFW